MMKLMLLSTVVSIFLVGCPPTPNPPPTEVDAAPGDVTYVGDSSLASLRCCTTMSALGCSEGKHPSCAERIDLIRSDKLAPFDDKALDCCAGAGTKAIVRTCAPSIKCE